MPLPSTALWLTEYNTPYNACCHGILEVLYQTETPYQKLIIVKSGCYRKALILDGCWQSCEGDEFIYHEALVHPACIFHGSPRRVLVLGGGEGAALREVLKWKSVRRAVVVDLNGDVIDACRRYLPEMSEGAFDDSRTEVVVADAYDFLDNDDREWDVIVSDLTDPLEEGPSYKLFAMEYFEKCRQALASGGHFAMQAGLAGPVEMGIRVRLARTIASVFDQMIHYIAQVPTWASPMGFIVGADCDSLPKDPDPEEIDAVISELIEGDLHMLDGRTMRSLMHPPKYLRDAVAKEKKVYTSLNPPVDPAATMSGYCQ